MSEKPAVTSPKAQFHRGDMVGFANDVTHPGYVLRAAIDGSWVDVDWGRWHKRQPLPSSLQLWMRGRKPTP